MIKCNDESKTSQIGPSTQLVSIDVCVRGGHLGVTAWLKGELWESTGQVWALELSRLMVDGRAQPRSTFSSW